MQQAIESINMDAARAWAEAKMQADPARSRCQVCRKDEARLRVAEKEPGGPFSKAVSMDVCSGCAPEYLRKLADIIESGDEG